MNLRIIHAVARHANQGLNAFLFITVSLNCKNGVNRKSYKLRVYVNVSRPTRGYGTTQRATTTVVANTAQSTRLRLEQDSLLLTLPTESRKHGLHMNRKTNWFDEIN